MELKSVVIEPAMIDRAWRGYDPRAGFASIAVAALASIGLLAGRWLLDDLSWIAEQAGALAFYAMTIAVWPGLLATLTYRAITYTYRLTDRAVLVDWGFRNLPEPPLLLVELVSATAETTWIGRCLGIGCVRLNANAGRSLVLVGVADPQRLADAIRAAAAEIKASA